MTLSFLTESIDMNHFDLICADGGLANLAKYHLGMAKHLYNVIDGKDFNYKGAVRNTAFRALTNICWTLYLPCGTL